MVALVLTIGLTAETIEGLVRVSVAEFEPFFHCKVSISGYVWYQKTVDTYLAKGDGPSKVLVETMQGVTAHASGRNITAPGGHG